VRAATRSNYRKDTMPDDMTAFAGSEVIQLSKEELFERFIKHQGEVWSVNEHPQHAIQDFCKEVYKAWATCQERLNRLP
jgi:hypothetical protein